MGRKADFVNAIETLEVLPGEGEVKTTSYVRTRQECAECGEQAHFKHTYLFDNARSNPASSAYRHDDCTWCSDAETFACKEHESKVRHDAPRGMGWCSTFPASERFAHMFLYWREVK